MINRNVRSSIHQVHGKPCPRELAITRIVGATAASILLGAIGFEVFQRVKANRHHQILDQQLDRDLELSMHGSEPTASY